MTAELAVPLAPVDGGIRTLRLVDWAEEARAAYALAQSLCKTPFAGQFKNDEHGATAAILRGAEMGLTPVTSLGAFDLIQGQPAPKAITLRALCQSNGHSVWIERSSDTECIAKGRRRGEAEVHESKWTMQRATRLGLNNKDNWKKQPQAMLVARATSEVCRMVAADVLLGIGYSSEELIDAEPLPTTTMQRDIGEASDSPKKRTARRAQLAPTPEPDLEPEPPAEPANAVDPRDVPATRDQVVKLNILLQEAGVAERDDKIAYLSGSVGRGLESSKDLTKAEAHSLIDALEREKEAERAIDQGDDTLYGDDSAHDGQEPPL